MKVDIIKLQEAKLDLTTSAGLKSLLLQVQKYQTNPNINAKTFQALVNVCNQVFNSLEYQQASGSDSSIPKKDDVIKSLGNLNNIAQSLSQANKQGNQPNTNQQKATNGQANNNANANNAEATNGQATDTTQSNDQANSTIQSISQKLTSIASKLTDEQKTQLFNALKQSLGIQ